MRTRIVDISNIHNTGRLDGSYFTAEANLYDEALAKHTTNVLSNLCSNIFTSSRGPRNYTIPKYGYPFLSNSDMVSRDPFVTCNYTSKKKVVDTAAFLKEGMILTGRVGAIGEIALVPKYWETNNAIGSDNIIRIVVKPEYKTGYIYAYLASKVGYLSFIKHATGGVQPYITDKMVGGIPIPDLGESIIDQTDSLIKEATSLREKAYYTIKQAENILKEKANLEDLSPDDYDYFGPRVSGRKTSCYELNIRQIGTTTFNAFNHSERIRNTLSALKVNTVPIKDVIIGGQTFSSTGIPSIEVKPGKGIMLINQKDIFDNIIKGKYLSKKNVNIKQLVEYGEVLIACDGTLGEGELFCRPIFANEDLDGAFVSSHFLRMRTLSHIPSGYLFCWLNSEYGFRFIRNTQAGTKLCHPIPTLFLNIPVPIIDEVSMRQIDELVKTAHTNRHLANEKELRAISIIEKEIENWIN